MRKILLLFIVSFFAIIIKAQDTTVYVVSGKIIDAETLKPASFVYLLNTSKRLATQSDTAGKFRILMMRNDKIRISSIGYKTQYWQPDFNKAKGSKIRTPIYIIPKTYKISAVNIYAARWKSFIYSTSKMDIEKDKYEKDMIEWVNEVVADQDLASQNIETGIRIPLPIRTHREKMLEKIDEQKRIDRLNAKAEAKYNAQFVSKITGLKGKELNDFMNYCSFDRDFILKTSEYELIVIVNDIYEEYKLKH